MNKLTVCAVLIVSVAASALARPEPRHHRPEPKRPPMHRPAPRPQHKPPKAHWGVNITPWGSSFSVSHRVGRSGNISWTLPLTPAPVIREEKVVVVQQPVIVKQNCASNGVELNPIYANPSRTWVEGYWKVTRSPDGRETNRVWVPGHWEEG